MRCAFLRNNVVMLVDTIDPEDYSKHIPEWEAIIDVAGLPVEPKIGWTLIGNKLGPVGAFEQQRQQRLYGQNLALELVDRMGARNIELSAQGAPANITSLLSALAGIKALIETGALKTARGACAAAAPNFPQHQDILVYAVDSITSFLQARGWD